MEIDPPAPPTGDQMTDEQQGDGSVMMIALHQSETEQQVLEHDIMALMEMQATQGEAVGSVRTTAAGRTDVVHVGSNPGPELGEDMLNEAYAFHDELADLLADGSEAQPQNLAGPPEGDDDTLGYYLNSPVAQRRAPEGGVIDLPSTQQARAHGTTRAALVQSSSQQAQVVDDDMAAAVAVAAAAEEEEQRRGREAADARTAAALHRREQELAARAAAAAAAARRLQPRLLASDVSGAALPVTASCGLRVYCGLQEAPVGKGSGGGGASLNSHTLGNQISADGAANSGNSANLVTLREGGLLSRPVSEMIKVRSCGAKASGFNIGGA
jgi:hypothetical protein